MNENNLPLERKKKKKKRKASKHIREQMLRR